MHKEIVKIKNDIDNVNKEIENRTKPLEKRLEDLKLQMQEEVAKINSCIIDRIIFNMGEVKCRTEHFNAFKFDGIFIDCINREIVIYISDNKSNKYEIILENGEFVYKGKMESEDLDDDMKYVLDGLNYIAILPE